MKAKQLFMGIVLGGAALYFFIKYLPDLERLFDDLSSAMFTIVVVLVLLFMGYRVLRDG
jgi:hypothetical protein